MHQHGREVLEEGWWNYSDEVMVITNTGTDWKGFITEPSIPEVKSYRKGFPGYDCREIE